MVARALLSVANFEWLLTVLLFLDKTKTKTIKMSFH